jgi:hypothetical protein
MEMLHLYQAEGTEEDWEALPMIPGVPAEI